MPRKTPILLRRGPLSGRIEALTRYSRTGVGDRQILKAQEKYDVSADFDCLVLEELIPDPACSIVAELDGAARGMELTEAERRVIAEFRERLVTLIERHNARLEAQHA